MKIIQFPVLFIITRGINHGGSSDLALLWCKLAAIVPMQPLVLELPYAAGTAL